MPRRHSHCEDALHVGTLMGVVAHCVLGLVRKVGGRLVHRLEIPDVVSWRDGELKVLRGDNVPSLVHQQDGKAIANRGEELSVYVMLDVVANGVAKRIHEHLAHHEEKQPESLSTERPPLADHKQR